MNYKIIVILLLSLIPYSIPLYSAESTCSYCGAWIPFSEKNGSHYLSNDRLIITDQTIALPGCSPSKTTQVFFTEKSDDYIPPESARVSAVKTILKIEHPIQCTPQRPGLSQGTLVEVKIRPRGYENSEELELTLFSPTSLEDLKASYTFRPVPSSPGEKQKVKRPPRPKELGGWWFIRENYDPCAEGAGRGTWICSAIKHKKADEELNYEWNRLLSVIKSDKKISLIATQRKWLKKCSTECAKEGIDSGYHPWGLANETFCLASKKKERSIEFRELYDCINSGKLNCPQLKDKP